MTLSKIVVVGSCNTDMVVKVNELPKPGETVLGEDFNIYHGGKGANQAVAIARFGGSVSFVTKIGDDQFGKQSLESLQNEGIDISNIITDPTLSTGVALIVVNREGENSIAVASGANAALHPNHLENAKTVISKANILLMQLEIPISTVLYAAKHAVENGVKVILNPAPVTTITDELLKNTYAIIPNRVEAESLSLVQIVDWDSAKIAADIISSKGVEIVVITLGEDGAFLKDGSDYYKIPGNKVEVIDSTAAGDTFCGTFCVCLSEGMSPIEAVKMANKAASIAVSKAGAQSSIPFKHEIINY